MSTEDIVKVIAHSKRQRNITQDNTIYLEEEIADLDGKPALSDDERIILDRIAGKLQMYDSEFQKCHYRLVHYIDDEVELQVQQGIFHDHGCKIMNFFKRMTNLRPRRKMVTPLPNRWRRRLILGHIIIVYS